MDKPYFFTADFQINDRVKIIELDRPGRITGIFLEENGITYRVRYFQDGGIVSSYLYFDELKLVDSEFKKCKLL